jgi:hypothetical protein
MWGNTPLHSGHETWDCRNGCLLLLKCGADMEAKEGMHSERHHFILLFKIPSQAWFASCWTMPAKVDAISAKHDTGACLSMTSSLTEKKIS